MPQNTNLNISPYFDDFDENNDYYKVLFKPAVSVQTRELITLQSILQNQIEKFGRHFFEDGAMVIPGQVGYDSNYHSVEIDSTHLGIPVSIYISQLVGKNIQGQSSGVTATVDNIITDLQSERSNFTLYVKYTASGKSGQSVFKDGENIITLDNIDYGISSIQSNNTIATTILSNSTSTGSVAKISQGVYFIRGFFVSVQGESIILDQYTNTPSYRIGLEIQEEIAIASNDNLDLFDNAQGFANYTAPGADRLRIKTTLIKKLLTDTVDTNFIELLQVENGEIKKYIKTTQYSYIKDELARRTYDESGNYSVTPFQLTIRESLDNLIGNNGIYNQTQTTSAGNTPSDDLGVITISPGKGYVKGYEIETITTGALDFKKPRDTSTLSNTNIPFTVGTQLRVNNIFGSVNLGLGTGTSIDLLNRRTTLSGVSTASKIGTAKLYDFTPYSYDSTYPTKHEFEISLFDIQTYSKLTLNSNITISPSAFIEGTRSNANGYLAVGVAATSILNLYQVAGQFIKNEPIRINGSDTYTSAGIIQKYTVSNFYDYNIDDIKQLYHLPSSGIGTFKCDTKLSKSTLITDAGTAFTIYPSNSLGPVISCGNQDFTKKVRVGDILSYTKPGETIPTYNRVTNVGIQLAGIYVENVPSVSGICSGIMYSSNTTFTDLKRVSPEVLNLDQTYLYSKLSKNNIKRLNLSNSTIQINRSYNETISSNTFYKIFETDPDLTPVNWNSAAYSITYKNTGTVEILDSSRFKIIGTGVSFSGLTETGPAIITTTYTKSKPAVRKKSFSRCSSLTISRSSNVSSGLGAGTIDDGLTYNTVYGTRVQDKEISLNVCDVSSVLGIFESTTQNDPNPPSIIFDTLSADISGFVRGELLVGSVSGAVASYIESSGLNSAYIVYRNTNVFTVGEDITSSETKITGVINSISDGDIDITGNYIFNDGQRLEYLDYSRITRKSTASAPLKKLKIIFNNYTISSSDSGDFVGVNSYDIERYNNDIRTINDIRITDIIDARPRVSTYSLASTNSPFEYTSRDFTGSTNSSPHILPKEQNFILSYDYYLPRIDTLALTKDGDFKITYGVSADIPSEPTLLPSDSMKIATITSPSYLYHVTDSKINYESNKRYTMKDIGNLETRLTNVEYTTALNQLEQHVRSTPDVDPTTKLSRFQSGFFVDNFRDLESCDIKDPEFRAAINPQTGVMRPQHYTTWINLLLGTDTALGADPTLFDVRFANDFSGSGGRVRRTGNTISIDYTDVLHNQNLYASDHLGTGVGLQVNEFAIQNWIGYLELKPNEDIWFESPINDNDDTNATYRPQIMESWDLSRYNSPEPDMFMRPMNIETVGKNLKPYQQYYCYVDNINMTDYFIPKILEISSINNTAFQIGETVVGYNDAGTRSIRFRVAHPQHKFGPYNNPTVKYVAIPYGSASSPVQSSTSYTSSATYLNIDTASLAEKCIPEYWGSIEPNMRLIGETSGALAKVSNNRIIASGGGEIVGCIFIPDFNLDPRYRFPISTKTILFSIDPVSGFNSRHENTARANFFLTDKYSPYIKANKLPSNLENDTGIAQVFDIQANNGVFLTKCDLYFKKNATSTVGATITVQIREVENGTPTNKVVEYSRTSLNQSNVSITGPTTFTFGSLVYLEPGKSYAIVVLTEDSGYEVATSRIGSKNTMSGGGTVPNVIPKLGSLFKTQSGTTWQEVPTDKLTYTLYRASFKSDIDAVVRFFNPQLNVGNNQKVSLKSNPITSYSRKLLVGLSSTYSSTIGISIGSNIKQVGNTNFSGVLSGLVGPIGISSTLSITNVGTGYTVGLTTYLNIPVESISGTGNGARINLTINNSVATGAVVTQGGSGYTVGDDLIVDNVYTSGIGKGIILTIPNSVGVITSFNSLVISDVKHRLKPSGDITYTNISGTSTLIGSSSGTGVTSTVLTDGLHFKVTHTNHGMYENNAHIELSRICSDVQSTILTTDTLPTVTLTTIPVGNVGILTSFEGLPVSAANTGYIRISQEIISYTGLTASSGAGDLTGIVRGIDDTAAGNRGYAKNTPIYKYEMNGVSLRRINKVHTLIDTNITNYPTELDSYHIKIDRSNPTVGLIRDGSTADPELYFNTIKTGGSTAIKIAGQYKLQDAKSSQNIHYQYATPIVKNLTPNSTSIQSRIRTISATSVNGTETPYVDMGYEDVPLNPFYYWAFNTPRTILNKRNELLYLPSPEIAKSFTLDLVLNSNDERVSPIIDLNRVGVWLTTDRSNRPIENFIDDYRVNSLTDDPHAAIYISKPVKLTTNADKLKVIYDAALAPEADVRVLYKLFRSDLPSSSQIWQLFPGYDNRDSLGNTIDRSLNDGTSDINITQDPDLSIFNEYTHSETNLSPFTGFQIKIIMSSAEQGFNIRIKNLRVIATI